MKNNLLKIYDALGLPSFLTSVYLETSAHCQLSCKTCYRGHRKLGNMSQRTFEDAYQQIGECPTVKNIYFHVAGEPTLNPLLPDFIDWFENDPYNLILSTNGMLPVNHLADKVDMISFSLGGIEKKQEENRAGSIWEVVEKNILDLAAISRQRAKIGISLVRTDETDAEIDAFRGHWHDIADHIAVNQYQSPDLQVKQLGIGQRLSSWGRCGYLRHSAAILWNGDITTCCSDLQGINCYSNIHKTRLKDIKTTPGPLCKNCDVWRLH